MCNQLNFTTQVISFCILISLTISGSSQIIYPPNSGLNYAGGVFTSPNELSPNSWSRTSPTATPDVLSTNVNADDASTSPGSNNGGTWAHMLASHIPGSVTNYVEGIRTTISGLTVGKSYMIHFEQALAHSTQFRLTGRVKVMLGPQTSYSPTIGLPAFRTMSAWQDVSVGPFTATSTNMTIAFEADKTPWVTGRASLHIDGVYLRTINTPPTANDATVSICEGIGNGDNVHNVVANDLDGDALTYSIVSGNVGGAFTINNSTGEITVANSAAIDPIAQPTYNLNVRVQDPTGDNDQCTITINVNPSPAFNTSTSDVTCSSLGSITINTTSGTAPFQYSNDNGVSFQASNSFTGLPTNSYNVVVRDASLCSATQNITINGIGSPSITSTTYIDPTCGNANGSITVNATGGTAPIEFNIDGGTYQASNIFSGLVAGTYTMGIRDANSCTATLNVTLTDPGNPTITSTTEINATCGNNNGSITVIATGGAAPIQYNINGGAYQASNVFSGLPAGTYTMGIQDANSCVASLNVILTNVSVPSISGTTDVNPICGNSNGSITVNATGGIAPIEYNINGGPYQALNIFTGLAAGSYSLGIRDANSCTATINVTLTDVPGPTISNTTDVDPTCGNSNGSITVNASGGTAPIEYNINGGVYQASNLFSGLPAGTYTIEIRDANLCTASTPVTLSMASALTIDNISKNDVTCIAQGDITITASGGTPPLEFSIDNGISYQASNFFGGLSANTYDVVVRDANLCTNNSSVTIDPGTAPTIDNVARVDETCAALGSLTLTASGGNPPYSYSIDGGATYLSNNSFSNLSAGSYDIIIRDDLGCMDNRSVTISPPSPIIIDSIVTINDSCSACQGEVSIYATGPASLEYSIDNGLTTQTSNVFTNLCANNLNIVVSSGSCSTNGNGIISDVGSLANATINDPGAVCVTQGNITLTAATTGGIWSGTGIDPNTGIFNTQNSGPGNYNITYTIGGACGNADNIILTVTDTTRPAIDPVSPLCVTGGSVGLTATTLGGTWSGIGVSGNQFDPEITGPGTHYVLYSISGTCTDTAGMSISVTDTLNPGINPVDPVCVIGSPVNLTANIDGGTWSGNGVSHHHETFNPQTAGAGTHKVYYTVTGICVDRDSINIAVSDTITPGINPVGTQCTGNMPFQLTSSIPGGTWSGNGIINGSNGTFDPAIAQAGTHTITYTTNIGACSSSPTMNIDVFDSQDATIAPAGPFCSIDSPTLLTAVDGAGLWSGTGITTSTGSFDPGTAGAGIHEIIYTIAGVCGDADTIMVEVVQQPDVSITAPPILCIEGDPVQLTAATAGGIWGGFGIDSTGIFTPAVAGNFVVTYSIPGFCGNFDQITVVVEENPIIEVNSSINNTCSGAEVTLSYISTVPLSNCSWDFGDGTTATSCQDVTHSYTQIGCYDVTVFGDSPAGCRAKKEATDLVCIHPDPIAEFESDKETVKTSYPKIAFTNLSENAVSYVWDFAGKDSSTLEHPSYTFPTEVGYYNVCLEATSQFGCTDVVCHEVYVEEDQLINIPNAFTPNGDGLNDKFVPVIRGFGETPTYNMQIWNRWGELIFETENVNEFWDGKVNGSTPISHTFVWKMYIYDDKGTPHDFMGHVTVLR